jgi:P-type Ca2+ transporter type 2C
MSMICVSPENQAFVLVKGAAEAIFSVSREPSTPGRSHQYRPCGRPAMTLADAGLRVLALAYRPLECRRRTDARGTGTRPDCASDSSAFPIRRVPRRAGHCSRCREAGIKVIMVTGDHRATAVNIARQLGISRTRTSG